MSITTTRIKESIICSLPDGRQIEISMVSLEGEEVEVELDLTVALRVLQHYLRSTEAASHKT